MAESISRALPLFMTDDFFRQTGGYAASCGTRADYEEREVQSFDPPMESARQAAERVFHIFQNIDENHMTPDAGRSMMVGDCVELTDSNGTKTLLRCESFGFARDEFQETTHA